MDFETFMKLSCKDTLIYDPVAIEIVPDHQGKVHHFLPVSAATIRLAAENFGRENINENWDPRNDFSEEKQKKGLYKYVQVVNTQIRNAFTKDQLIFALRNPVNDLFTNGYPIGELDLLMNIVSAHLNAETFNRSLFTNGFVSQGIINLKGEVADEQLKALRRSWYSQGVGTDAMFKTPITNAPEGMEFIKLDVSHKEMEYSNYINYLIKVICAVYLIDPEEINFQSSGKSEGGSAGNSQNYNNVEKKLKMSRDKGLRPLLRFFEKIINEQILPRFSDELHDKYIFRFVGLRQEDRENENSRFDMESKSYRTIDEVRAEAGYEPLEEGGNIIRDPAWMQWYAQFSEAAQKLNKEMMGAEEGMPGEVEETGDVVYQDEDGNEIDPNDLDEETMEFTDEDGNEVNKDGGALEAEDQTKKFEFDEEEARKKIEAKKKLPFEDDLPF